MMSSYTARTSAEASPYSMGVAVAFMLIPSCGQTGHLLDEFARADLAAIAPVIAQRPLMPLGGQGDAGIGGDRHQVAQVTRVTHGRVDTLIGQAACDDQRSGAEITQHVVDVGRDE